MNNSRSMWLSLLLISLVIGSLFLMIGLEDWNKFIDEYKNPTYNSYMTEAEYLNYNQSGLLLSQIKVEKAIHNDQSQLTHFLKPNIFFYTADRQPWYISANQGDSQENGRRIKFSGHVLIRQPAAKGGLETIITTSSLVVYPQQKLAITHEAVTIHQGDTIVSGTGLQANFKTGQYQLLSQARGIYVPTTAQNPLIQH